MTPQPTYRIGIDIGGIFSDIVTVRDDGLIETRKVPSTPDDYSRSIAAALKAWLGDVRAELGQVSRIVHAMTVRGCAD
jgi:N-methylhydantoinase A